MNIFCHYLRVSLFFQTLVICLFTMSEKISLRLVDSSMTLVTVVLFSAKSTLLVARTPFCTNQEGT